MQFTKLASLALVGLAGCGADPNSSSGEVRGASELALDPAAAAALPEVDQNLERLRALGLFEVRDLIVTAPAEAGNAALRLEQLVDLAETASDTAYVATACIERVDKNLNALRALQIVELGDFIRTEPAISPNCYNLPCQEDIAAANLEDEARAADLENIAIAAQSL